MDIKVKGIRRKSKILWEVENWTTREKYLFWRTENSCLTKEYLKAIGLDVAKYGAITRQKTFRDRRR